MPLKARCIRCNTESPAIICDGCAVTLWGMLIELIEGLEQKPADQWAIQHVNNGLKGHWRLFGTCPGGFEIINLPERVALLMLFEHNQTCSPYYLQGPPELFIEWAKEYMGFLKWCNTSCDQLQRYPIE